MFCTKTWLLSLVISLLLPLESVSHATPIEGGELEVEARYQDLLRSVVKFENIEPGRRVTCSSTLVSRNILLTALHCAEGIREKDSLRLNGHEGYRVVKVIAAESKAETRGENVHAKTASTDWALIFFEAMDCERSALKSLAAAALARPELEPTLTNQVLIAGYGRTTGEGHSQELHAGINEWAVSDYSSTGNLQKTGDYIIEMAKLLGSPDDSMILFAYRDDLVEQLNQRNLLDETGASKRDFVIVRKTIRIAVGIYTSLFHHSNTFGITNGLKALELKRDAASYCQ